jgi:hypothetical protein
MQNNIGFRECLASAKFGTRINLLSAQFTLSEEELCELLAELDRTSTGRVLVRKADYDNDLLVFLKLKYQQKLEWN